MKNRLRAERYIPTVISVGPWLVEEKKVLAANNHQ